MSPIEQKLWDAMGECWDGTDLVRRSPSAKLTFDDLAEWHVAIRHRDASIVAVCAPQVLREPYCIDFGLLAHGCLAPIKLVIECDGHEFHERTKAQATRDRARDRALTADGFKVVRFTGSEIWRAPSECVLEVLSIASSELQRQVEIKHLGREMSHAP